MIIFCSHSSKDMELVRPLQERIEAMGWELYLFEDDKQPGEYVASKLQRAIERASVVLVLLTHNSKQSNYVHQEIGYAAAQKKPIIPLVEHGVSKRVLGMLDGQEYLSFQRGANSDDMLASIFESLQQYITSIDARVDLGEVMRDVLIGLLVVAVLALGVAYLTQSGPFSPPELA
jgi:nucleoside 2-deoxyribosyltransferase